MRRLMALSLAMPIVLGGTGLNIYGQEAARPAEPIASARLLEDVEILHRLYETAHPGLYRYNTREQVAEHFNALRGEFDHDRTLGEAYIAFSQFLAKLRCGHSYANFFNQPRSVAAALFEGKNRVPFTFRWIGGRMILTRDLAEPARLAPGTEVLQLAGVPVQEILQRMLTIARADGSNDAKRRAYLEVAGDSRYEAFDIFLPLVYPQVGERIALRVREPGRHEPEDLVVEAHTPRQREALARRTMLGKADADADADAESDRRSWSFRMVDDRTACLRMPGWALFNTKWDWKAFLDRGIDDLIDRRVPALIIDLRGNEGGLDCGNLLLERIAPGPIRAETAARYVRYRTFPQALDPFVRTWDNSFKDWGDQARDERGGFFRLSQPQDDGETIVLQPRGRRFEGRVIVLVGASNSSATFQFARLAQENRLAILVGQATGGNLRGINGGAFFFATLPNSRIEVDLPLIASFPLPGEFPDGARIPFAEVPDRGLMPDVAVEPSVTDITRGIDTELEAARALLREEPGRN